MRRQPKTALLAVILVIGLCSAAVATSGVLVAAERQSRVELAAPLMLYPVTQRTDGACPAGTRGVTGPEPSCYEVAEGIIIRRVGGVEVRELRDGSHGVSLELVGADRTAFAGLTRAQRGRQLVVVVNGKVITAPWVDAPITGGEVLVTGRFTRADAQKLVADLTGGRG